MCSIDVWALLGRRRSFPKATVVMTLALAWSVAAPVLAQDQGRRANEQGPLPSIAERTEGMRRIEGFFPLYWDDDAGTLWMEINRFGDEVLHVNGLGSGLGSNDIGIDRGALQGSRVVAFERVGRKILMVQPNYRFRANTDNPAEVRAVTDAFARSVLWGFTAAAQTGNRLLVDMTEFLLRDATNLGPRLRPGNYRFDGSRSSVYMPMTQGFPENTEIEVELTFVRQAGGGGGGFGAGSSFQGVGSVAATSAAASVRLHHAFVQLPDTEYRPRRADPRAGYGALSYRDYAAPLGAPMTQRVVRRHRLKKRTPSASVSEPVEPIVYYLDPGTPEPVRSALMEGASWWNEAFEAAGYRNAFRVELRPDSISPLDARYNVINWVHRSTRGWSTGGSVTDPRTGEIIKGVVTLGSLRIRQDYLIAEGLLSPYGSGDETPPELAEWALARIRQLAAHEVGHTLGLSHNYYDSRAGRISVMDYPHPLITLNRDGSLDYSDVYDVGIGEWDKVAIRYGYQEFPVGAGETEVLARILDDAWDDDVRFLTNQDIGLHPKADQWSNGTDAAEELNRMMDVRRTALTRFGENAIKRGTPLATMEEVLVPLYLHHRYQVQAAASVVGGVDYRYAMRGDGGDLMRPASAREQEAALDALLATLEPSALALPRSILQSLPPRPAGYPRHRELFPRYTGPMFDAITPAVVAADHTVANVLNSQRAARLVEQHALDESLLGLEVVIDALLEATFGLSPDDAYEAEVNRAVERVLADRLMALADGAAMPQVRAVATQRVAQMLEELDAAIEDADAADAAHFALLVRDMVRFLDRPGRTVEPEAPVSPPPGAPIGEPAMRWIVELGPVCGWEP